MFLDKKLLEETNQSEDSNKKSQQSQPQRFGANRFQAKKPSEQQQPQPSQINSRINQKEKEKQEKAPEQDFKASTQAKEDNEEQIVKFDSDSDDQKNYKQNADQNQNSTKPLLFEEQTKPNSYQQQGPPQNVSFARPATSTLRQPATIDRIQNNSEYKKQLGQSSSSYWDQDIKLDQFKFVETNNSNVYHEPGGLDYQSDNFLLKKQENKITLQNHQLPQKVPPATQEIPVELKQRQRSESSEISIGSQQDDQDVPFTKADGDLNILYEQQQKEDQLKKQLKQNHEKIREGSDKAQKESDESGSDGKIKESTSGQQQLTQTETSQKPPEQEQKQCPYPKPLIEVPMTRGKSYFLVNPAPKGGMIQCTIKRDRSGMARFYPKYHMHLSNGFLYLMSAKKQAINNTSNYIIAQAREDMRKKENYLGKVRSNFMGTEFTLYDAGMNPKKTKDQTQFRQQLGVVFYESNILGSKGPRKMMVLLPKVDRATNQVHVYKPANSSEGILHEFKTKNSSEPRNFETCVNRPPQWNNKHKAFVLNFYQRVDKPSVKNFQLVVQDGEDNILLQFGRVGEELFNIDFQWPITPLQAFQIALTSFDYKIACE